MKIHAPMLAIVEGISGLLIFGCVISKLVSQRQEDLIGEIHRTTFEDRLGRVRTNLHLVLSELQAIAEMCDCRNGAPERVRRMRAARGRPAFEKLDGPDSRIGAQDRTIRDLISVGRQMLMKGFVYKITDDSQVI